MKKLLIGAAALSLLGAGCFGQATTSVDTNATGSTAPKAETAIKVENEMAPGDHIMIDSVTLADAGFVVIHQDANGQPGGIIANSAYLTVGTHTNVEISVSMEKGKFYWAMIHADNGNQTYSTTEDPPAKNAAGAIVMMRFEGASEEGMDDTKMDGSTDAKVKVDVKDGDVKVDVGASVTVSASIQGFAFSPAAITVKKGSKIKFTNQDSVGHTVTADGGAFGSALIQQNGAFVLDTSTLAAGTYAYHCTPHPTMKGTIIVQ